MVATWCGYVLATRPPPCPWGLPMPGLPRPGPPCPVQDSVPPHLSTCPKSVTSSCLRVGFVSNALHCGHGIFKVKTTRKSQFFYQNTYICKPFGNDLPLTPLGLVRLSLTGSWYSEISAQISPHLSGSDGPETVWLRACLGPGPAVCK